MGYRVYVVSIQDVKDLIGQSNVIVCHTLREGNQCTDYFAKLGDNSDSELIYHVSPPVLFPFVFCLVTKKKHQIFIVFCFCM